MSRRVWTATLVAAGLLATAQPAQAGACHNSGLTPQKAGTAAARRATICEINRVRAYFGVPPVRFEVELRTAAGRHARDMVRRDYFSHRSLDGSTLVDRAAAAGVLDAGATLVAGDKRLLGENLGWERGRRATPLGMVVGWLTSDAHREVLLDPRYGFVGVGIALGAPKPVRGSAATYVADFGS